MAVDLSDLIDPLKREVSAPGIDQLPDATDAEYLGNLQDGFWEATLDGAIVGYTESDAIVTPTDTGGDDLSRQLQQLVVFYAGYRIVRNQLRNINTLFRAKSGANEYETQQAASLLKAILDDMTKKRDAILESLVANGVTSAYYLDAFQDRDSSQRGQYTYWVR